MYFLHEYLGLPWLFRPHLERKSIRGVNAMKGEEMSVLTISILLVLINIIHIMYVHIYQFFLKFDEKAWKFWGGVLAFPIKYFFF